MTRSDAQDHLDLLARDVASPLPAGLLDTARGARRRRTRGRLAAGGAVVAVAAVGVGVALPGGTSPSTSRPPVAAPGSAGSTEPGEPTAPAGTRWVTAHGQMVAVPVGWERTEPLCSDGILTERGEGLYYLYEPVAVVNDCISAGLETTAPTVVLSFADGPEAALDCDATCTQIVVAGDLELRFERFRTPADVTAVLDTVQPLPDGWVVDPADGTAAPLASVQDSRLVTARDEVVGEWTVIEVAGGPVPVDAERGLRIGLEGERNLGLSYWDGVNDHYRGARVYTDGTLKISPRSMTTLVGCSGPSCGRPSGFGVADAVQARLTPDGELVLVGADGTALAVYERA